MTLPRRIYYTLVFSTLTLQAACFVSKNNHILRAIKMNESSASSSYGEDLDQMGMMESDMLICVDRNDVPVGKMSKKQAHQFTPETPRGFVHRAFSVFIFNDKGEMLLTKRASSKITFPNVWTNACCSHPLWGQTPNEVDDKPVESYPGGQPPGIKYAAIRKLKHELGIEKNDIELDRMRFLTRFHYWAADSVTYSQESCPWGEHEIDYVLFLQYPDSNVQPRIFANPDEVGEYKYVSIDEMKKMMKQDNDLLWSPWFRGIMERCGFAMWENLDEALTLKSSFYNTEIEFFDPPEEHTAFFNLPEHTANTGVLLKDESPIL